MNWNNILGLPPVASAQGPHVDNLIIWVHWLMAALFVGWFGYFVYTLIRFRAGRNPRADHTGVKSHASSYLELLVALIEGVLLIGVAIPFWAKAVDKYPNPDESTVIQVVAQQFQWNVRYPGKDGEFGKQDMTYVTSENVFGVDPKDPKGKDDVQTLNDLHVPLVKMKFRDGTEGYKPVIIFVSSKDVIHSFKVIALRMTQDAIPGLRIPLWFTPTREGRFQINCAQLCGNGHSSMAGGFLTVESQEAYDKWLASKAGAATSFE